MWNSFQTGDYAGLTAETLSIGRPDGSALRVYYARPLTAAKGPGIILIPHMPGWDEWCRETSRRFAEHGFSVLCPDIYQDFGTGTPTEVSAAMREAGGVSDDSVMTDTASCLRFLNSQPLSNGRVGVIGMCSGGRHAYLAACTVPGLTAAVDCWGGGVVCAPDQLNEKRPVQPLDYTEQLSIPLLGIFGNEDFSPTPADVDQLEARLQKAGKEYEFHRYEGAGHGFWYYDKPAYRQEQAMDSWNKVLAFFRKHLFDLEP